MDLRFVTKGTTKSFLFLITYLIGDHKVLFVFDNLSDVDKILHNQPWSFDKHLVVLQRYVHDIPLRSLPFNKATF